jgi:hypothetical protein
LAELRATQASGPSPRHTVQSSGKGSAQAIIAVQHACEVLPAASRAIGKAWSDSSGAACSAGVATITASNGPRRSPSSTSHHCRPSWTSPLTRQSNVTSC